MHPHIPAAHRNGTQPTLLVRTALACVLSAPLVLGVPGSYGVGVALADTSEVETAPMPIQENAANAKTIARIERKMAIASEEQALRIALKDLGLHEEDVDEIEVDLEDDEKPYKWEVEFEVGDIEYEYEINPYTGAIMSLTRQYDSDDPFIIRRVY